MSDIKKWGADENQEFTDTSKGKLTYRMYIDGVIADVSMFKAAPDMYKALEELLKASEMDQEQIESEWGSCRTLEQIEADGDLSEAIISARAALAKARGECHE